MKLTSPWTGILSFIIVLFMMPLGHAAMILMEKILGHNLLYLAALLLGVIGVGLLVLGIYSKKEITATFAGLFGGMLVWTGWVEFAYVYYANRYGVQPLIENGEIVTKPEYLIMPSSVGFWAIIMLFYIFSIKSNCVLFTWIQDKLHYGTAKKAVLDEQQVSRLQPVVRNHAMTTFMEMNIIMWTCYIVLLFVYDERFFGDHHPVTSIIAFGSLAWSIYLFVKLLKIKKLGYAIRYAIPTVIIFWTFVEIMGRWDMLKEIWVEPSHYWMEMTVMLVAFVVLSVVLFWKHRK
ncbi:hypothetical protein ACGE0T_06740 [Parabacteroides sp. APC149_11_2_Y6]